LKIETKYRRIRKRIHLPANARLDRVFYLFTLAAKYQLDDLRRHPPAAR
jgi:hypothetical protein